MFRSPDGLRRVTLGTLLALPLALGNAAAADEFERTGFLIRDSATDRTPAKTAVPRYPRIARRDRIEGDATVCFRVDYNGKIRSVRVENYTHRIFRRPALKAIKDSSYQPLEPDELLNTARTCRTYRFRLEPIVADNNTDT